MTAISAVSVWTGAMGLVLMLAMATMLTTTPVLGATSRERYLGGHNVVKIKEFRHFESMRAASSSKPLMVLLFANDFELDAFGGACGDKGGLTACLSVDLRAEPELGAQILQEAYQEKKPGHLYPVVLMWYGSGLVAQFQPDITFESITYYFDRIVGGPLTTIRNAAHLIGLMKTDRPLVLGYFPKESHLIDNEHYHTWQWYQSLARLASSKLLFTEVNDPALVPSLSKPERPLIRLSTDHWADRVLPAKMVGGPLPEAGEWLVERSFGTATKLQKKDFESIFQRSQGRAVFVIWVLEFVAKNERYQELADILSFHFGKWLRFHVASIEHPELVSHDPKAGTIQYDVGPSQFGVRRAALPVVTILLQSNSKELVRYRYEGELEVQPLKQWIARFLKGSLEPLTLSQDLSQKDGEGDLVFLSHDLWASTVEARGELNYLVIFWNSEYPDVANPQLQLCFSAASVLRQLGIRNIIIAAYDTARNDMPPNWEPTPHIVMPIFLLGAPDNGVYTLPPSVFNLSPERLAHWLIFRIIDHGGLQAHFGDDAAFSPEFAEFEAKLEQQQSEQQPQSASSQDDEVVII